MSLVTREADENLSTLSKEKLWIFEKRSFLRLREKPADALAQAIPPIQPQKRDTIAIPARISPVLITSESSSPVRIPFISLAVMKGMTHSIPASKTMQRKVITVGVLNSLTDFSILRYICSNPAFHAIVI